MGYNVSIKKKHKWKIDVIVKKEICAVYLAIGNHTKIYLYSI